MGIRKLNLLIVPGILFFGMSAFGVAQDTNPLRSFQGVSYQARSAVKAQAAASQGSGAVDSAARGSAIPVDLQHDQSRTRVALADTPGEHAVLAPRVEPAAAPKDDMAMIREMMNSVKESRVPIGILGASKGMSLDQRLSETPHNDGAGVAPGVPERVAEGEPSEELAAESKRASAKPAFDQAKFQAVIKSLALNTGLVLCVGVAFIFIAKQWFQGKKPKAIGDDPTIQIKSTLRLGPKSNLFLVEAGGSRLIVASDPSGIKSVVTLTESFASTLDPLDPLSDLADGEPLEREPSDSAESNELLSELYSRASLGKRESAVASRTVSSNSSWKTKGPKKSVGAEDEAEKTNRAENEIRRKMEEALGEHGLKELFMQTLQSNR